MKDKTDLELCEMYKTGNEEAFETLWERYVKITYRIVNKQRYLLKNFDKDDLLNDCAIKMLDCIEKFKDTHRFITFYTSSIENMFKTRITLMKYNTRKVNYEAVNFSSLWSKSGEESDTEILDSYIEGECDTYEFENEVSAELQEVIAKGLKTIRKEYREAMYKRLTGEIERDDIIAEMFNVTRQSIQWNRRKVINYIKDNYKREEVS